MATTTSTTATASSIFSFLSSFFPSNPPPPAKSNFVATQPQRAPASSLAMTTSSGLDSLSADASAAICPALANANVMFFRSAYNVQVIVDENEHEEKLLGRFRREVMRAGIIQECKRRKFFENRQEEKKRRTRDAAKRNRKRRPFRPAAAEGADATKAKKDIDDGDNWDLPEGM
uniref:Ribosomal protein S21 n=1 Tax=Kalanchoe fedtschenkoi TaxID=63787 RepID=A0A7N0URP1_KALFE